MLKCGVRIAPSRVFRVFQERVADRLGEASFDLPLDLLHVDRPADVVNADDASHAHLAGECVHLDLDGLRGVAIAVVRDAGAIVFGEHRRRRRAKLDRRLDPLIVAATVALERLLGGVVDRAATHQREPGRRGAPGVRRLGGIVGDHRDAVERQVESLGRDLPQCQV